MGDARPRGSYTFASLASTSRFFGALLALRNCTAIVSSNLSHFTLIVLTHLARLKTVVLHETDLSLMRLGRCFDVK